MVNKQLRYGLMIVSAFVILAFVAVTAGDADTQDKSFPVKKGGTLLVDIENAGADILVKTWSKGEVHVQVMGISGDDLDDLKMGESGNTVTVEYYGDNGHGWGRSRQMRFTVSVPEAFNLDLSTSGGDIVVSDPIKGDVEAATSGGDVEVDVVDGKLSLKTSGGDISARDVLQDASLKTSGGDIEVGNVKGELSVATAGGDIDIGMVDADLTAKTAGGDIMIENVGGDAKVATAGGDIEVGTVSGSATLKTAGGNIELGGASGTVAAKTAGGDIECFKITGSVDAATAGGDVYAELDPKGNQTSSLETSGGDVTLVIPAGADATIDARIRLRGRHDEYDITSDFKAKSHDKTSKNITASYVLGKGGPRITLDTVNGKIGRAHV